MTSEAPRRTAKQEPKRGPIVRRVVAVGVTLAIAVGVPLAYCSSDWKSAVYRFDVHGSAYRVRVTGSFGTECARLERRQYANSELPLWVEQGTDCDWPRVTGGDGWLAGGLARPVYDEQTKKDSADWLFHGIVPAAATEVELTLAAGPPIRIPTRAAGGGGHRIYAHVQPGVGERAEIVGLALHDANGGDLRVY